MNYYREKVQIVILVLLYCVAFIIQYLISQNINVWFDETYSMITANMTFSQMWDRIMHDNHPFIYPTTLWMVEHLFPNSLKAAKLLSLTPVLLCSIWVTILWRRYFKHSYLNFLCNVFYTLVSTLSYNMIWMGQEIRSYSLATMMLTLMGIYLFLYFLTNSRKHLALLVIFTALGVLTHYYLIFFEGCLYLVLLIMIKVKHKNFIIWLKPALFSIVEVCWWLPFGLRQIHTLGYSQAWSQASFSRLPYYFTYIISSGKIFDVLFLGLAVLLTFIALLWLCGRNKSSITVNRLELTAGVVYVCLIFMIIIGATTYSVVVKPFFIERYSSPALGLFWLGLTLLLKNILGNIPWKLTRIYAAILVAMTLIMTASNVHAKFVEEYDPGAADFLRAMANRFSESDLFVTDIEHLSRGVLPYYLHSKENICVYRDDNNVMQQKDHWYKQYLMESNQIDLKELDLTKRTVWYFSDTSDYYSQEYFPSAFEKAKKIESIYSGEIDQLYYFTVYKVEF